MCICLYLSVSPCTITHHPFVGQNCKRIRQLQNWGPGRKTTSFADLPLTGQAVLFQSGFIHSRLEKWTEYDSEADDDDGGGDRRCSITGRLMFYPSAQPLCVNATLNYLVVWVWGMHPALEEGNLLHWGQRKETGQREQEFLRNCPQPCLPGSLSPSCLFGAAWLISSSQTTTQAQTPRLQLFKLGLELQEKPYGALCGHLLGHTPR